MISETAECCCDSSWRGLEWSKPKTLGWRLQGGPEAGRINWVEAFLAQSDMPENKIKLPGSDVLLGGPLVTTC